MTASNQHEAFKALCSLLSTQACTFCVKLTVNKFSDMFNKKINRLLKCVIYFSGIRKYFKSTMYYT